MVMVKRFFASVICVVAMVIAGSVAAFAAEDYSAEEVLQNALDGFGVEVSQRFETSPMLALNMLEDALRDGVISVQVELLQNDIFTPSVGVNIVLSSLMVQQRAFLDAQLYMRIFGIPIGLLDTQVYVNVDRFAIGSSLLGDELFGSSFDTFIEDFWSFGQALGLTDQDLSGILMPLDLGQFSMEAELVPVAVNMMHGATINGIENVTQIWFDLGDSYTDFYLDQDGRLLQIDFFSEDLVFVANFGDGALSLWTFGFFTNYGSFWVEWEIEAYDEWWINRFDYGGNAMFDYGYIDIGWNPTNGMFLIYLQDDVLLDGIFIVTLDGFAFETIVNIGGDIVFIAVTAAGDAFVPDFEFTNFSYLAERVGEIVDMFEMLLDLLN